MADSIQCPDCNRIYALKPELAGKTVRCKCGGKIRFPSPVSDSATRTSQDMCPHCQAVMPQGALLCTQCGFNKKTGRGVAGAAPGGIGEKAPASGAAGSGGKSKWAKASVGGLSLLILGVSGWYIYQQAMPEKQQRRGAVAVAQTPRGNPASARATPAASRPVPVDPGFLEMQEIIGPKDGVGVLAISGGGKLLAAAGLDKAIHLFDLASGKELQKMEGHEGTITDTRFSPDDSRIVSTGPDGLRIWETATGKQLETLVPEGRASQGRFMGNDQVVTAVGSNLLFWKTRDGTAGKADRVIDTGSEISCMDVSPDGQHIVVGQSEAKRIRVWDVGTGAEVAEHEQGPPGIALLHFGEQDQVRFGQVQETAFLDNDHILVGAREAGSYVLEWKNGKVQDLGIHLSNTDKPQVWAGDQTRILWNIMGAAAARFFDMGQESLQSPQNRDRTGRMISLNIGGLACSCVALRGDWAAVGSSSAVLPPRAPAQDVSKIRVIKLATMEVALAAERQAIQRELDKANAAAVARSQTPRGKLETAFAEAVKLASVPVAVIDVPGARMREIRFSPDGRYLAGGGADHVIRIYDTTNWKEVKKLAAHTGAIAEISFSKDGKKLLSAGSDSAIILWDVTTGQIDSRVRSNSRVFRCGLMPDGKHAVTTGFFVQFWDMEHEKLTKTGVADEQVWGLAISSGGTVATMDNAFDITIWDPLTGQAKTKMEVKDLTMRAYFLDDKTLRFFQMGAATDWNWETGEKKPAIYADVGLSPDGKLGVNELRRVIPSEGGGRLITFDNEATDYDAGAIDPLNRYIAYGKAAYWSNETSDFESTGPGKICIYDVKTLEAAADEYRKIVAYDKEHNLDEAGKPLKK